MRQTLLLALALFVMFSVVKAADSSMSITTSKAVGQTIKIALKAENVNTIVHIDYGDGVLVEKTIGTSGTDVSGILKGSTVKVYGEGIIWFYCDTNKLTDVDVTNYPSLLGLNCNNNNLTSLDLSQNTLLRLLYCANNALTELDISNNKALESLRCHDNQLTSFDVSNNGRLFYTKCFNNELTFASLPSVSSTGYKAYEYAGQADVEIIETITDGIVDLSNQYSVSGNLTNYTWKTEGGTMLTEGVDYDIEDGVTSFLNVPSEKVYCEMTNASFPDFIGENVLKTTLSTVEGVGEITDPGTSPDPNAPAITMTTGLEVGQTINFQLMAQTNNSSVLIDYGDGNLIEETIATSRTSLSGILKGSEVKIYGEGIITFTCDNQKLSVLDVSNAIDLVNLECRRNQLTSLDLSNNVLLEYLHCYYNSLISLDVSHNTKLETLICSSNQIEELDVTANLDLKLLSCGTNKIDSLDVSGNLKLTSLNCRKNEMSDLQLGEHALLTSLKCELNNLNFSHLPALSSISEFYSYSPQDVMTIQASVEVGQAIDLRDQFLVGDNETTFVWITEYGEELIEGEDYLVDGGLITFLKPITSRVSCTMSNSSLTGMVTEWYHGFKLSTTSVAVGVEYVPTEPPAMTISYDTFGARYRGSDWGEDNYSNREGLLMKADSDSTILYVDYGDGVAFERIIGTSWSGVSYELRGEEVKIYGSGITSVSLSGPHLNLRKIDLSNCPEIEYVKCVNAFLNLLDVSGAINLRYLCVDNNGLNELDISSCIHLDTLGCQLNNLSSLDVSNNSELKLIACDGNNLESLDLSNNPLLSVLSCSFNQFTSLDVSNMTLLTSLECRSNDISFLDVTGCSSLSKLYCFDNELRFSTLPILPILHYYYYYILYVYDGWYGGGGKISQADIEIDQIVNEDSEVDLSSEYEIEGSLTNYSWLTEGGTELIEGEDYEVIAGVTKFLTTQTQKVYCQMTNAIFPLLTLNTTLTSVGVDDIIPAITLTTNLAIGETMRISMSYDDNTPIKIDYGDGVLVDFTSAFGTVVGPEIKIYGNRITSFTCNSNQITSLDISKCPLLESLVCSSNALSSLDLSNNAKLDYLTCYENQLTTLDVSYCPELEWLFCSSNRLTSLNVSNNSSLRSIYCQSNELSSLDISSCDELRGVACYDNQFTFATLPYREYDHYFNINAAPQADIEISSSVNVGSQIDLSSQYEVNGNYTVYIWKTESGAMLIEGVDIELEYGLASFLLPQTEKVYCEMTNSTFPDLTLKTTLTEIIESPGNIDIEPAVVNVYGGVNSITLQTETNALVEVYDIYGKPIVIKNVDSGQNTINGVSQGMYVVKVKGTKIISTQKVTVRD